MLPKMHSARNTVPPFAEVAKGLGLHHRELQASHLPCLASQVSKSGSSAGPNKLQQGESHELFKERRKIGRCQDSFDAFLDASHVQLLPHPDVRAGYLGHGGVQQPQLASIKAEYDVEQGTRSRI